MSDKQAPAEPNQQRVALVAIDDLARHWMAGYQDQDTTIVDTFLDPQKRAVTILYMAAPKKPAQKVTVKRRAKR